MAAFRIWLIVALAAPGVPEPVAERASAATARLVDGDVAAAFGIIGDDELRNAVVLEVRDMLVVAFAARDEATDEALAAAFAALVDAGFGGALSGQAQGEALMWAEALWEEYIHDLDDGYRVDLMLGAVLKGMGGLSAGARVEWARRILGRTGLRGLADAALGLRSQGEVPAWLAGPDWRLGAFLYRVMDSWVAAAAASGRHLRPKGPGPGSDFAEADLVTALTPLLDSRLLLDRLLAVQGLKRIGTPAAGAALEAAQTDKTSLFMYLHGHTVSTQAGLALQARGLVRGLEELRVDMVAAGMDPEPVDRMRRDILTDLDIDVAAAAKEYGAAVKGIREGWQTVQRDAVKVRGRWQGLLRAACRKEVDASPGAALLAGDTAWQGRTAEACLERLVRDAAGEVGAGVVFRREDALAAVGLALKARERVTRDLIVIRARAYLRTVAEAAYETARGREEIDSLTHWTMDDPDTAAVVRRIIDLAFARALADGLAEGPERDGAAGLLREELDSCFENGSPAETVMACLVGLRWQLLWRDAGSAERSIHVETAWARFDEPYWEQQRDLRDRMRVEPYAREILEDLARDDEDVTALRWSLAAEDRPLLERIRTHLLRARTAAGKAAQRTSGVPDDALEVFTAHHPVLEEIGMTWLAACFGERPVTPAPAGLTEPKPPKNPMDLRRAGPPRSAYTDVVHDSYAKIRDCYDQRRKRRPGLEGTLTVEIEVSTLGKVAARVADDGLEDAQVARCVLRTIRRLGFPIPPDKVHVFRVPFHFTP